MLTTVGIALVSDYSFQHHCTVSRFIDLLRCKSIMSILSVLCTLRCSLNSVRCAVIKVQQSACVWDSVQVASSPFFVTEHCNKRCKIHRQIWPISHSVEVSKWPRAPGFDASMFTVACLRGCCCGTLLLIADKLGTHVNCWVALYLIIEACQCWGINGCQKYSMNMMISKHFLKGT